jgi:hypothetical protein
MGTVESPHTAASQRPSSRSTGGRFEKGKRAAMSLTVVTRRQTPAEARRYTLALDSLVAEVVRTELARVRRQS